MLQQLHGSPTSSASHRICWLSFLRALPSSEPPDSAGRAFRGPLAQQSPEQMSPVSPYAMQLALAPPLEENVLRWPEESPFFASISKEYGYGETTIAAQPEETPFFTSIPQEYGYGGTTTFPQSYPTPTSTIPDDGGGGDSGGGGEQSPFLKRRRFCWSESGLQFLSSFFSSEITIPARAKLRVTGRKRISRAPRTLISRGPSAFRLIRRRGYLKPGDHSYSTVRRGAVMVMFGRSSIPTNPMSETARSRRKRTWKSDSPSRCASRMSGVTSIVTKFP